MGINYEIYKCIRAVIVVESYEFGDKIVLALIKSSFLSLQSLIATFLCLVSWLVHPLYGNKVEIILSSDAIIRLIIPKAEQIGEAFLQAVGGGTQIKKVSNCLGVWRGDWSGRTPTSDPSPVPQERCLTR